MRGLAQFRSACPRRCFLGDVLSLRPNLADSLSEQAKLPGDVRLLCAAVDIRYDFQPFCDSKASTALNGAVCHTGKAGGDASDALKAFTARR